jgi:polysaccharide pyruvyl transferase WcaK-like protein
MATGTPLVGVAYHVKTREFMHQFECEEYCIDDSKLTTNLMLSTIDNLRKNIDVVGQKLYDNAKKMSDVVKKDMRKILNEI